MNQNSFNPFLYEVVKHRQEELIKEATIFRMVKEARKNEKTKQKDGFNLIALLGRELSRIGFSLEVRYSSPSEPRATLMQQNNTGGCT